MGICIERCHVHVISEQDGVVVVDRKQCISCGLCVTGYPEDVPKLQRKLDVEIVISSVDFATWEQDRLWNWGLIE